MEGGARLRVAVEEEEFYRRGHGGEVGRWGGGGCGGVVGVIGVEL